MPPRRCGVIWAWVRTNLAASPREDTRISLRRILSVPDLPLPSCRNLKRRSSSDTHLMVKLADHGLITIRSRSHNADFLNSCIRRHAHAADRPHHETRFFRMKHEFAAAPHRRSAARVGVSALPMVLVAALVVGIGISFWVPRQAGAQPTSFSLWSSSAIPRQASDPDTDSVSLGTVFSADEPGDVTALRFYKSADNRGPHAGALWTSQGRLLAQVDFPSSPDSGWVTARLATPVALQTSRDYVVSYVAPAGRYSIDIGAFAGGRTLGAGPLTATSGVYDYAGGFPTREWRDSAYLVDIVFSPNEEDSGEGGPTPPPTVPTTTPNPTVTPQPSPSATPIPTVSPSTSPTSSASPGGPRPVGCATRPSACGYPDDSNTGPSKSSFVRVPQDIRSGQGWAWNDRFNAIFVSGSGAVLDGLDVSGQVNIDAPNVTLSNSRVAACGGESDSDVVAVRYRAGNESYRGSNARIVNNVIMGTPSGCQRRARSGVRDVYGAAPMMLVDGNDISGAGNGITAEYSATILNNWVHNLGHVAGDHHSGISTHGGAQQVTVRHNTVLLHGQVFPGGGGVSGALTVYADFAHAQNFTAQDNLISGGSYVVYGGNSGDDYETPSTNVKFLDNRFVCGAWLYGPVAAFSTSSSGNEWSGNYCDQTGAPVSR